MVREFADFYKETCVFKYQIAVETFGIFNTSPRRLLNNILGRGNYGSELRTISATANRF